MLVLSWLYVSLANFCFTAYVRLSGDYSCQIIIASALSTLSTREVPERRCTFQYSL